MARFDREVNGRGQRKQRHFSDRAGHLLLSCCSHNTSSTFVFNARHASHNAHLTRLCRHRCLRSGLPWRPPPPSSPPPGLPQTTPTTTSVKPSCNEDDAISSPGGERMTTARVLNERSLWTAQSPVPNSPCGLCGRRATLNRRLSGVTNTTAESF